MHKPHPKAAPDRPTVVLVHDDPNAAAPLIEALDDEGFAVAHARNVNDAASRACECSPDLIVLAQLRQPFDEPTLMRLRGNAALRDVPLVVVRGRNGWRGKDLDTFLEHVWRTINAHVLSKP
jgi:DNA-binding response OmpR family regulator